MLRQQARKLRQEIEEFENQKQAMEQTERERMQDELNSRQALIDQYSVVVPILKPDGMTVEEKIQFPPRLEKLPQGGTDSSAIFLCEATLPLGILLGEHESLVGMTEVDEVAAGSNGEKAGIREGDLLRACTACKVEMEQPTWQLIAGGIGRPKTVRYIFSTDFKPFEMVMEAVASNRMDPEGRPVLLVLERRKSN
ncbi:hypothetical protein IV203_035335 [Nitzschia inconspicua]|uniref:PDZ domain-containing protein n=1 Tax=Nitzschia inconspicua TaxID=303405 RepID=A0A9K3PUV3_9STRA|nr:hypothetical protein IV203_035335 [Nitzschia inconspicua]